MKKLSLLAITLATLITLNFSACTNINKKVSNIENKNVSSDLTNNFSTNSININNTEIHFINTDNSDSILIKGEKNVLIDGADNDDEDFLVNYIKKEGILELDYIIATHSHADHIGGLDSVVKNLDVNTVFVSNGSSDTKTYKDFINALANKKLFPSVPLEDTKFDLGNGAYMQFFNTNGGSDTNNQSLVTLYINGNDKFLFTGDADTETEDEILSKLPDINVLKIGHHGSRTSSSEEFLDKTKPEYAVITVGKDNKYGHPHKATMEKVRNRNIEVHRTDECKDIIFTSTSNGVTTSCIPGSYNFRDTK